MSFDDEDSLDLFGDEKTEADLLSEELERELHLDHFLEEADILKEATELALRQIAEIDHMIEPLAAKPEEKIALVQESIAQFSHTVSARLDSTNQYFRDGIDVLDGRIALATRMLNERHDEQVVSMTQVSADLNELNEQLAQFQSLLLSLRERLETPIENRPEESETTIDLTLQLQELGAELLRSIDTGILGVNRSQQDVEARLARLEAAISRQGRRTTRASENPFLGVLIFLLLVNALMILWLRFWL